MPSRAFFDDEDFQDVLVKILLTDISSLRALGPLLHDDDFKPLRGMHNGRPRWIVAGRALEHYRTYNEPLGELVRSDVLQYADSIGLGARQSTELEEYLAHLRKGKPKAVESIVQKVLKYKRERLKASAIQEMAELQAGGQLSDEKFYELCQQGLRMVGDSYRATSYFDTAEARIARRAMSERKVRIPSFFIDQLDSLIQGVGPGQLGMVLAPPKRGKSLFLLWISLVFVLQRFNTLLITLEDPQEEVENRLDAIVSGIHALRLAERPKLFKKRFQRYRRLVRSRLSIIDGTEEGLSVSQMEQIYLRERDRGFRADAIVIDYDDEIRPGVHHKERRMEFADIYRDLRRFMAKHNLVGWTAAQTQRGTENMKILTGDRVAEDISKVRKVSMALSLGKGEWSPDSIYLWVAANKFDRMRVGCNIEPDYARMMIYDREATRRSLREYGSGFEGDDL